MQGSGQRQRPKAAAAESLTNEVKPFRGEKRNLTLGRRQMVSADISFVEDVRRLLNGMNVDVENAAARQDKGGG